MRPPILFLSVAFGAGLAVGLDVFLVRGAWYVVPPVLATALLLIRRAPLGAALGIMGVAGLLWGAAAGRERDATCAGVWGRESGSGKRETVAAAVRLLDPVSSQGGVVDAEVLPGSCGGPLRLRWPGEHVARGGTQWVVAGRSGWSRSATPLQRPATTRGGTQWVVAGRWSGVADRGVLVVRRLIQLEATPRGR